jgi:P27 family predicted phage terminase small subunit
MKSAQVPPCPAYLAGSLAKRWDELAPELWKLGTLDDLNADMLAKYILAENNYLMISNDVQEAIAEDDAETASKWLAAQDRLTKQILALAAELGITPKARRARGLTRK